MNNKIKLISKLNFDIKSDDIDKFAKDILDTNDFIFDEYEDKLLRDYIVIINNNKLKWNDEYFKDHLSLLDNNFSKERLEHILEIRNYLYIKKSNSKKKFFIILIIILIGIIYFKMNNYNKSLEIVNKVSNKVININENNSSEEIKDHNESNTSKY